MKWRKYLCKVCGLTQGDNIRAVEQLGVDLVGLIFYPPSPRFVSRVPDYLPARAKRVGVFVNPSADEVRRTIRSYSLDYLQLHGHKSPARCRELRLSGLPLIKAFAIATADDLLATAAYEGICDYFLFDTKSALPGGSGRSFDWTLLDAYAGRTPFLLSGGIGPEHAEAIRRLRHPLLAGLDLNSRFESAPGIKDITALQRFLNTLNI